MNINIINPFITTGYAGAAYFCDREQETADITRMLVNGNNVALISPRRYGKTNLIRHCFAQPEIADRYLFYEIRCGFSTSFGTFDPRGLETIRA